MTQRSPPSVRASSATSIGTSLGDSRWERRRNWLNSLAAVESRSPIGLMAGILAGAPQVLYPDNGLLRGQRVQPGNIHRSAARGRLLLDQHAAQDLLAVQAQHRQVQPDAENPGLSGGQVPDEAGDVLLAQALRDDRRDP